MSELIDKLDESKVQRILEESFPKPSEKIDGEFYLPPIKPPEIETEGIFDSEPADDPFEDNPMKMLRGMMGDLKEMTMRPGPLVLPQMPPSEHKVKIFRLHEFLTPTDIEYIEGAMEKFLNDGYRCHAPAVCGDFLIMDFSRIKESEEDGKR